ncbi:type II restriction endonuclease [Sutterella sp.]|uniref:type II restriction endonuclease n=1 Tax=Sutterella sp. TaxID=1981025 RepID=UPI0026E0D0BB|nr:type II restriction endonuclease [Sutterella sp.]MDO5532267.1 type II restriction endonuclease [Sutterella sp.]
MQQSIILPDDRIISPEAVRYAVSAIDSVRSGSLAYCKFLSANDTKETGAHQAGFLIGKSAVGILFDRPGVKGENLTRSIRISWQDGAVVTNSSAKYYGQKTRNEYRITGVGYNFPFREVEYTGALFVLVRRTAEDYEAFVLNTEDEIDYFLDWFGLSPAETNALISTSQTPSKDEVIAKVVASLNNGFPTTAEMSRLARETEEVIHDHVEKARTNPDEKLINWTQVEYALFRGVEESLYKDRVRDGVPDLETFLSIAKEFLQRRKSRAGKSLENHLQALFDANELNYSSQAVTEENKKPDFIFPSIAAYHDSAFPTEYLTVLAAKTTCKDRWRQVLNEADRMHERTKYLCTLQQGNSSKQLHEMKAEGVVLVVPKKYISTYPREYQGSILSIREFIEHVSRLQALHLR